MFLAQIKQAKAKKKNKKQRKLHLSAAQQLVASQEADGHFDAFKLSFKMARVWEKLGIPSTSMPSGINTNKNENDNTHLYSAPATGELSIDMLDATVFVLRLFELYVEKSGYNTNSEQQEKIMKWFGSGGILGDNWYAKAEGWLTSKRVDWKVARSNAIENVMEKWFDTEAKCKHKGTFVDKKQLQAKQEEIGKKFAASQIESLRRDEKWIHCTSADIYSIEWKKAVAVGWCMGGEGGAYPVRFGENEKLIVKRCNDVGDVIAEEFAKMVGGICSAPLRFIAQASSEYIEVQEALINAEPDEPEIKKRLKRILSNMQETGYPLMVMEFIHGEPLTGYKGSQILQNVDGSMKEENREELIKSIGRTIAFDCLINNWDRFPSLLGWPRKGNLENILVSPQSNLNNDLKKDNNNNNNCNYKHKLVFIDQAVKLLTIAKDQVEYFDALRSFVKEVAFAYGSYKEGIDVVVTGGGGMERIKKAIRGQVLIWTGDKTKDAEIYERYMVKPDSVSGVELDDIAIGYIIDGISEVFCHAKTLHTKFTRKRNELSTFCYELFLNVNNIEQDTKLTDRIEACLDFIDKCIEIVEVEFV